MNEIISKLKNNIIVSCQAGKDEPMYSPEAIILMTKASIKGGAKAIRAESPTSIRQIKHFFDIPVIGLYKKIYQNSEVYITPTRKEVDSIAISGSDIIAIDATNRKRPFNEKLEDIVNYIHDKYNLPVMADISNYEEGINAEKIGFDLIATTLSGYTSYSKKSDEPDFELLYKLSSNIRTPIILEGRVWEINHLKKAFKMGAYSVVIGSAITRPNLITKRFCNSIV
jgi:N-acylglucosamine-6-phosphate 2-epimerase